MDIRGAHLVSVAVAVVFRGLSGFDLLSANTRLSEPPLPQSAVTAGRRLRAAA